MKRPHFTKPVDHIERADCEALIRMALMEDAPFGDPTSDSIFPPELSRKAHVVSREAGVLCGSVLAGILLDVFAEVTSCRIRLEDALRDGDSFSAGARLLTLDGSVAGILRVERVLLNFLQYLSGIATTTQDAVSRAPAGVFVLDTRKTLPGYRRLVKYAVYLGSGTNHRINLSEMAMIKDNHVAAAGGISRAADKVRAKHPELPLEIEIDELSQIEEALACSPRVILLDNMDVAEIEEAARRISNRCAEAGMDAPVIEVSGGWTPARLHSLASVGLPIGVSMGYLTHTTRFLDLSLEME